MTIGIYILRLSRSGTLANFDDIDIRQKRNLVFNYRTHFKHSIPQHKEWFIHTYQIRRINMLIEPILR